MCEAFRCVPTRANAAEHANLPPAEACVIRPRHIRAEATSAREIILVAGDTHIFPVTSLDGKKVGDGRVGPVATEIISMLTDDAINGTGNHHDL